MENKFSHKQDNFQHLCTELSGKPQHASTVRAAVSVETRVAIAYDGLAQTWSIGPFSSLWSLYFDSLCHGS